jgi:hypothetical protein
MLVDRTVTTTSGLRHFKPAFAMPTTLLAAATGSDEIDQIQKEKYL